MKMNGANGKRRGKKRLETEKKLEEKLEKKFLKFDKKFFCVANITNPKNVIAEPRIVKNSKAFAILLVTGIDNVNVSTIASITALLRKPTIPNTGPHTTPSLPAVLGPYKVARTLIEGQ